MIFRDRAAAGRDLAALLQRYRSEDPVVLGLVRGGVAVAAEVASALEAPLDVLVVRKVGVPGHPELAMGAVASGVTWFNEPLIAELGIPREEVDRVVQSETEEAERREALFREGHPTLPVQGRTVILVDDGLATGATAVAGLRVLRRGGAHRLVFAAPVCSREGARRVEREADELVCASRPDDFFAVSQAYRSFPQLTDTDVRQHLQAARPGAAGSGGLR
ncbi:MAG TPA: phosphoribosyltransferase family protein [Gemmatimonadales bacterium]|nr:phosphoribosyltransferase family protein [Gemmatimonadales bacterium]